MERTKIPMLIITFCTTTAAMAMEAVCGEGKGRLIPIPGEISGGCGLAWCAEPDMESELLAVMRANKITYQDKRILEMYG